MTGVRSRWSCQGRLSEEMMDQAKKKQIDERKTSVGAKAVAKENRILQRAETPCDGI